MLIVDKLDMIIAELQIMNERLTVLEGNSTMICNAYSGINQRLAALEQRTIKSLTPTPAPIDSPF